MVPLFGFLYNRGKVKDKNYSIFSIFPYFVLGFIGMIFVKKYWRSNIHNRKW